MFHVPFLLKETASCLPMRESICFSFASENFGWEFRRSELCVTPVFLQQQWGLTNSAVKTGALEVTSWMRVQSADIKFNSRALKPDFQRLFSNLLNIWWFLFSVHLHLDGKWCPRLSQYRLLPDLIFQMHWQHVCSCTSLHLSIN